MALAESNEARAAETRRLHVLVVEDDALAGECLKRQLEDERFVVDIREDGAAAVRDVLRLRPDIIVMDLGLPVIDGWAATRLIRQRARSLPGYRPHIIVLSGNDDAESRKRAFAAGCDEYVVKTSDVRGALRAYVTRQTWK